jgi:hypothetical protein
VSEQAAVDARSLIAGWARETANGGVDRRSQALKVAARFGPEFVAEVAKLFDDVVPIWERPDPPTVLGRSEAAGAEPKPEEPEPIAAQVVAKQAVVPPSALQVTRTRSDIVVPKPAEWKFHPSDLAKREEPITVEEKQRELEKLVELLSSDPLAYAEKRKELAGRLATSQTIIDQAVRVVRDQQNEGGDPNQATKIIPIGCSEDVSLWHGPDGAGHASVRVGDHWENYRIGSTAFEEWVRAEYGRRSRINVGGQWIPQVPGSGALRDAIATLGGVAKFRGEERQPALRIGGDRKVI